MPTQQYDPFSLSVEQLTVILSSPLPAIPELEAARTNISALRDAPHTQELLSETAFLLEGIQDVPHTSYTHYRYFKRNGDRRHYESAYFRRRANLGVATLRLFLGDDTYKDVVQDYLWSICEETTWVLPAHEYNIIDLFSAETAFWLAEVIHVLGDKIDAEVRYRVKTAIDQRILDPYLRFHFKENWYHGHSNWNGVCNSSVAAAFILTETDPQRAAQGVYYALQGLRTFIATAFEADGCSNEGVGYWSYGLINFVALSELLYARSGGQINLLDTERMRIIAAYPAKALLSAGKFASFSDSPETIDFYTGMVVRLAERTGEKSLYNLLVNQKPHEEKGKYAKFAMLLRTFLWWDGSRPSTITVDDAIFPSAGVARMILPSSNIPTNIAIKAGHNDENHNQNDVGSFILHVDGESLLTDPGMGLYTRQYFSSERYKSVFANSYGHSVPRIGGQLQPAGRQYAGTLLGIEQTPAGKQVSVEFSGAYANSNLSQILRTIGSHNETPNELWLHDSFTFTGNAEEIEEAFITWFDCTVTGSTAFIGGTRHQLKLTITQPQNCVWHLEPLEKESQENRKTEILKRLSTTLPPTNEQHFHLHLTILPL